MRANLLNTGFHGESVTQRSVADFRLAERWYEPKLRTPKHSHERAYLGLILEGFSIQVSGRREIERTPMAAFLYPPGEVQSERFGDRGSRIFSIEIEGARFSSLWRAPLLGQGAIDLRGGSLSWLAARLYEEFQQPDDVADLAIEGLMLELLALTSRRSRPSPSPRPPAWLKQTREVLRARFKERIGLAELSAAAGIHPVYLSSEFHRKFGVTVGEYVRQLRIEFACRELTASDAALASIALAAGFAHQAHFTRTFKKMTGLTPLQYRSVSNPSKR